MKHNKEKYGYGGSHSFRYELEYIIATLGTLAVLAIIALFLYSYFLSRKIFITIQAHAFGYALFLCNNSIISASRQQLRRCFYAALYR